jgi:DNA-directed RNA polymerase subunit RPC12/RpoP
MSPTEIPGEALKFLTRVGKKKCSNCKREYRFAKLTQSNGIIYKRCPHCNHILARYNLKSVLRMAARRGK